MRPLFASLFVLILSSALPATSLGQGEVPAFIPVQGYLTDGSGAPVEGPTDVVLRLYTEAEGDTLAAFHSENQTLNVTAGNFFTYLGDKQPLDVSAFKDKPKGIVFLGVTVQGGVELTPRLQIGLAPFAAFSQVCGDSQTLGGHAADYFAAADHTHTAEELGIQVDQGETTMQPPPKAMYYTADSSAGTQGQAIVTSTAAHALCALTKVRYDNPSTTTKSRYCAVEHNADGTWRLLAGGFDGTRATCTMACIF